MDPNTGKFHPDGDPDNPLPEDWTRFTVGETVTVKEVEMKIVSIEGSGLITLMPVASTSEIRLERAMKAHAKSDKPFGS